MKPALSAVEVNDLLKSLPAWRVQDGKLLREWTFKDFVEAMTFVNRIAAMAETEGHHPDIDIRYNHVLLGLVSHDAGGITERDARMAGQINAEFPF